MLATAGDRLAAAHARLEAAVAAHAKARAEDNRSRTPATKTVREAAVVELELAAGRVAELTAREFGL